jgi:hypothetical protein
MRERGETKGSTEKHNEGNTEIENKDKTEEWEKETKST